MRAHDSASPFAGESRPSGICFRSLRGGRDLVDGSDEELVDGSNELIPAPGNGSNIPRGRRVVAKRGANLRNAKIEPALEIDESFGAPDGFTQILAGDHLSGLPDQTGKRLRRL